MARADQAEVRMRIVVEDPVPGVLLSLQGKDGKPLGPKTSASGEPLAFDFAVRVAPGPRFLGDQVRREGKVRRFVYLRVGQAAGQCLSPWTRRMKIDIHDIPPAVLDRGMAGEVVEATVNGTAKDGSPACATVPVLRWRAVAA
jgi:hypothetical protein